MQKKNKRHVYVWVLCENKNNLFFKINKNKTKKQKEKWKEKLVFFFLISVVNLIFCVAFPYTVVEHATQCRRPFINIDADVSTRINQ